MQVPLGGAAVDDEACWTDQEGDKENPETHLGFSYAVVSTGKVCCEAVGGEGQRRREGEGDERCACDQARVGLVGMELAFFFFFKWLWQKYKYLFPIVRWCNNLDRERVVESKRPDTDI